MSQFEFGNFSFRLNYFLATTILKELTIMTVLLLKAIVCFCCILHVAIACDVPCEGTTKTLICYRFLFLSWNSCEETVNSVRGLLPFTCGCCAQNDDDADGICNVNDVCPGYDDLEDVDGNGIPDGCDDITAIGIMDEPTSVPTGVPTVLPTVFPTKLPTGVPTVSLSNDPSMAPTMPPTKLPTNAPTMAPTEFPTIVPTEFLTIAPTEDPITESACTIAVSLDCRAPNGSSCSSLSRRTNQNNCLVTLAYDITICNTSFDASIAITRANILLNGQSFDIRANIEPILQSQLCQTVTPRVEIDLCDPVALLAEVIVSIGDCGDSDSLKLSI